MMGGLAQKPGYFEENKSRFPTCQTWGSDLGDLKPALKLMLSNLREKVKAGGAGS